MKVIDAFPYFNEWEMLKARVEYLAPVVDAFVIAQSAKTLSGNKNPHLLRKRQITEVRRLAGGRPVSVVVTTPPNHKRRVARYANWFRDWDLKNHLAAGVDDVIADHDWPVTETAVAISDLDEIPAAHLVRPQAEAALDALYRPKGSDEERDVPFRKFIQAMFYYDLYTFQPLKQWAGTVIVPADFALRFGPFACRMEGYCDVVGGHGTYAGWHLSYFGGLSRVVEKVKSIAEASPEAASGEVPIELIRARMLAGKDLYGRPEEEWMRVWVIPEGVPDIFKRLYPGLGVDDYKVAG